MDKETKTRTLSLSDILSAHIPDPSIATFDEAVELIKYGAIKGREQCERRFFPFPIDGQPAVVDDQGDQSDQVLGKIRSRVVHSDPLGLPFWTQRGLPTTTSKT